MLRLERAALLLATTGATLPALAPVAAAQSAAPASARSAPSAQPAADPYSARALLLAPFQAGARLFALDASGALTVRDNATAAARTLLPAGSFTAVAPSANGRYVAYATYPTGATFGDVHVRDVISGRDLPDVLHQAHISRAPWTHNAKGFFFTAEEREGARQRIYYHSLGRAQSADAVILSRMDHPDWRYDARVSDDGQYAVFTIGHPQDNHTRLYFVDLTDADHPRLDAPAVKLVDAFDARYEFVDNGGTYFFLQTDRDAPRGRVVLANTDETRETRWPPVVPQTTDTLLYARTAGNQYVIPVYRSGGRTVARVYAPPGREVLQAEMHQRIDSIRKAREKDPDTERNSGRSLQHPMMAEASPLRLELTHDIAIPSGTTLVALNTLADRNEVYGVVRAADGSERSFIYDVTKGTLRESAPAAVVAAGSPSTR